MAVTRGGNTLVKPKLDSLIIVHLARGIFFTEIKRKGSSLEAGGREEKLTNKLRGRLSSLNFQKTGRKSHDRF